MKKDKSAAVGLVIFFVLMIAVVGAITFSNYERKAEDNLVKTDDKDKDKEPSQVTQGDNVQAEIEEKPGTVTPSAPIAEKPTQPKALSFSENSVLIWPLDGNVILSYSMDHTIYFATLDQYKYNPAIVISGQVGQDVRAAAEGEILSIVTDAQTGTTVTVDLGNGYHAVYGQLGEVNVTKGERISQGDLIGYLGEPTKYYSIEGCNLYFQLLKDGEPVNPMEYLDV